MMRTSRLCPGAAVSHKWALCITPPPARAGQGFAPQPTIGLNITSVITVIAYLLERPRQEPEAV